MYTQEPRGTRCFRPRTARALRLRWLWFAWKQDDRPWAGLDTPCDDTDRYLFHASTTITVGRWEKTSFWYANWIHGQAPKDIAPTLFGKTKRKKITVKRATAANKWVSHISPVRTMGELHEYISLWGEVRSVERDHNIEDDIRWRWTTDGQYTTQSAYHTQFTGRLKKPVFAPIWKARAEPKCRIFAWILPQHKILTTNNLAKRGWPHDLPPVQRHPHTYALTAPLPKQFGRS